MKANLCRVLWYLIFLSKSSCSVQAFVATTAATSATSSVSSSTTTTTSFSRKDPLTTATPPRLSIWKLRGGALSSSEQTSSTQLAAAMMMSTTTTISLLCDTLTTTLQSGPWGVVSLWAVASSVLVPLTLYRQGYSFSVGYGFSVLAMAAVVGRVVLSLSSTNTASGVLVAAALVYGFRLGAFLLLRNATVAAKREQLKSFDQSPPLARVGLALSVALFYACQMTPVLYAARGGAIAKWMSPVVAQVGAGLAVLGASLEAVADGQKYLAKRAAHPPQTFVGPTTGVYRLCRHPNYLGEVLFWTGIYVGGVPYFNNSIVAWLASSLGLLGIVSIMRSATKRLEGRQAEQYGKQAAYQTYAESVRGTLLPKWL